MLTACACCVRCLVVLPLPHPPMRIQSSHMRHTGLPRCTCGTQGCPVALIYTLKFLYVLLELKTHTHRHMHMRNVSPPGSTEPVQPTFCAGNGSKAQEQQPIGSALTRARRDASPVPSSSLERHASRNVNKASEVAQPESEPGNTLAMLGSFLFLPKISNVSPRCLLTLTACAYSTVSAHSYCARSLVTPTISKFQTSQDIISPRANAKEKVRYMPGR